MKKLKRPKRHELVHFCFVGDETLGVDSAQLELPKANLMALGDSLLALEARKAWTGGASYHSSGQPSRNKDCLMEAILSLVAYHDTRKLPSRVGTDAFHPIEIYPMAENSPIREIWNPRMAHSLREVYLALSNRQLRRSMRNVNFANEADGALDSPKCSLPEDVDIEDFMEILDCFGLHVENPEVLIDFGSLDVPSRLRSLLFLKLQRDLDEARDEIIQHIELFPKRVTFFVMMDEALTGLRVPADEHDLNPLHMDSDHFENCLTFRDASKEGLVAKLREKGLICHAINDRFSELVEIKKDEDGNEISEVALAYENGEEVDACILCVKIPDPPAGRSRSRSPRRTRAS